MKTTVQILVLLLSQMLGIGYAAEHILKLYTPVGQQWGLLELDCIYINSSQTRTGALRIQGENANAYERSAGYKTWRSNAVYAKAMHFGCDSITYWARPGYQSFKVERTGKQYVCFRYSKYSTAGLPVEIFLNGVKINSFVPVNTGDWNTFVYSPWIAVDFGTGVTPYLSVSPLSRSVSSAAGNTSFTVSSNSTWTASESSAWISVTKTSTTTLTVNYNGNSSSARAADITISVSGAAPVTVTIDQQGTSPTYDTLEFRTKTGQQYGKVNLDWALLSSDDASGNSYLVELWKPIFASTGEQAFRSNSSTGRVWNNFGAESVYPWYSKPGSVKYLTTSSLTATTKYIKVRYSKNSMTINSPIEIIYKGTKRAEWWPADLGSWNTFAEVSIILSKNVAVIKSTDSENVIVSDEDVTSLLIYPVPCHDFLIFDFAEKNAGVSINLYNAAGILFKKINEVSSRIEINTSELSEGLYFYHVTSADEVLTKGKFFKY